MNERGDVCKGCWLGEWVSGIRRRIRKNGDHVPTDHGKFYLSFTRFCLLFDGKRVSVTETNILLLNICMTKDFALFVANFVVVIYAPSRKV